MTRMHDTVCWHIHACLGVGYITDSTQAMHHAYDLNMHACAAHKAHMAMCMHGKHHLHSMHSWPISMTCMTCMKPKICMHACSANACITWHAAFMAPSRLCDMDG